MRAVDLIYAKRQGEALETEAIAWLVREYVKGRVSDYQMAAWLMAVYFNGLCDEELAALTYAMMRSGEVFDFSDIDGVKADKHSTGGVGDKVSLILAPLAAACGLIVPMVSGRGLGHTGGTLDKLESIPGFNVGLSGDQMRRQLGKIGLAMIGQTDRFVPADKKLYALRDVTATVESIPLIAASIMSKKMAEGCGVLVLDIKVGNGAFMKNMPQARKLGETMIGIGNSMGRKVEALLTDMIQPTGHAIGNANEVIEAIECLKGNWPPDLKMITYALTARMLIMGGLARNARDAEKQMEQAMDSGAALEKFRRMIEAQGGDPRVTDNSKRLVLARHEAIIAAPQSGYLAGFDTRQIGIAAAILGAGRTRKEDRIDSGVGIWAKAKIGETLEKGQPVFTVRYRKKKVLEQVKMMLGQSFALENEPVKAPKLIKEMIQ